MISYTLHDSETGIILQSGDCPNEDCLPAIPDGCSIAIGFAGNPETQRVDGEELVSFSPVPTRELLVEMVASERRKRLAAGFDYDFGDARGIHRIGTTEQDRVGWDDVSDLASAMIDTGNPNGEIAIVTDTGPAIVTATEWKMILLASAGYRQPIWAASFALQALDPIPQDISNDAYWPG